jgi:hypothetical protein
MNEVLIYVRTNKQGSECCAGGTGHTREEWDALSDEERAEITNELVWNVIDAYEKDSK